MPIGILAVKKNSEGCMAAWEMLRQNPMEEEEERIM
jgi:hypothetical protein